MAEFFVSPTGDDSAPGTLERPFATLGRARHAARAEAGGVVVHLREGIHVLTETFALDEDDSGRDGHRTVYQAFGYGTDQQEQAVVSGGREITGWRERDGVWLAEVGDLDTRQLHVDGRRAERAGLDDLPGEAKRTPTGYVTDTTAPLSWQAPTGVEFVYRGVYPWTEARCGVASVVRDGDSTAITMAQPAFSWANDLYNSAWDGELMSGPCLPTRVENDPAFLTEPGTFVLDRSRPGRHVLHYRPRPGEHPLRTRVVAPVLEVLLNATGTRDVSFLGLVFADATWLRPSGERGFLHYHGNGYYDGGGVEKVVVVEGEAWVTVPTEAETIPACVRLDATTGMRFECCRFTRIGATGLSATDSAGTTVHSCDFDNLAASAISVSGSRHVLIEDNLVQHAGLDYSGSPGIALLDTENCTVSHNRISDLPHCGIVVGPGKGARILRNLITDSMMTLADGGGIYVSGPQGDSPDNGAVVAGNVIKDTRTPYNFGLYTDYGAAWVTVEDNVVARADSTAVLQVSPPLENVVYRNNFWDADPVGSDAVPEGVTYESNTTLADETELDAATAATQARAGLLRAMATCRFVE
ncbi:right-handed parallel beta-helix repeat-containing protein [Saccharopolyspora erythraea]|uniref:right-handed parallel beta-helix repeat-containing protein n=1 Tax=Saccharopolyspora erythraea TaxID=1836 RepID=UPI001BF13BCE|nr:right-handed parallel beta-helix repeat-containing protein [Saccharopolyspora erythraea]QUH01986.1 right-handed parallel beta-helix repeat-containing protein [Saccharopolyspora erythraea]